MEFQRLDVPGLDIFHVFAAFASRVARAGRIGCIWETWGRAHIVARGFSVKDANARDDIPAACIGYELFFVLLVLFQQQVPRHMYMYPRHCAQTYVYLEVGSYTGDQGSSSQGWGDGEFHSDCRWGCC